MRTSAKSSSCRPSTVKSADRTLDILELLARSARPVSHADISHALAIPGSSLSELLRNLTARGYLTFTAADSTYLLGEAVDALVQPRRAGFDLVGLARPVVERVAKATGETTSLELLRDNDVERACSANSIKALRYWMSVGERAPAHAVSGGKAILAFLPEDERNERLAKMTFDDVTPKTVVARATFERQLARISRERVAYSEEEYELGVIGMAVPILNGKHYPVASMTVVIPKARADSKHRREIQKLLMAAAKSLEAEIRFREKLSRTAPVGSSREA